MSVQQFYLKSAESVSPEDDSIFANRLSLMLCSQINTGVVLRRGIAISDLKPKLKETRLKSYVGVGKKNPKALIQKMIMTMVH